MSSNISRTRPDTNAIPRPRSPGYVLREDYMRPRGMTMTELARLADLPVARVRGVIVGEPIDATCAKRFAAVFCTTALYWMVLQGDFDMAREQRKHEYGGLGVL